jgi:hypothetical protein
LIGLRTVAADLEPLLGKDERQVVFARHYDSNVRPKLPCLLTEQIVCRGRKDKRGAGSKREPPLQQGARRQGKCENHIPEPGGALVEAARIHVGCGIEKRQYWARQQRPLIG